MTGSLMQGHRIRRRYRQAARIRIRNQCQSPIRTDRPEKFQREGGPEPQRLIDVSPKITHQKMALKRAFSFLFQVFVTASCRV